MEINNPVQLFSTWYQEHLRRTDEKLPATCCLSTIGLDNYPNSRCVALKEITEEGFIITGTLTSQKGREISKSNRVALTFWWSGSERQVRIQGDAVLISNSLADKYFSERNRDSQIVSTISDQGKELLNIDELIKQYDILEQSAKVIEKPQNWGGYLIKPKRIEFLEFKSTRFHDRTLYEVRNNKWETRKIQP